MQQDTSLHSTLAIRERHRDDYWRDHDPIAEDRLLWRAQAFRHAAHLFPGQTILELGCGEGAFHTRSLAGLPRGESDNRGDISGARRRSS
jgi:dolichol-phosphate mannosyltransferase